MFLDAALKLGLAALVLVPLSVALALGAGAGLWKSVAGLPAGVRLLVAFGAVLLIGAAVYDTVHEEHQPLMLDLRQRAHVVLSALPACADERGPRCASDDIVFDTTIVFADGARLALRADAVQWRSGAGGKAAITLTDRRSHSLESARKLLHGVTAALGESASAPRGRVDEADGWIARCCKDNAAYSELHALQVRPELVLEMRKNVDQVSFTYIVTPGRR